jgi:large subunit ribosomal protein L9
MKVILTQDVPRVGKRYDVVAVADGYAQNFLFPQGLAERATDDKVAILDKKREAAKVAEEARMADLKEKLEHLEDVSVTIEAKADDKGNLYKKLHADDIVTALKDDADIELPETAILLDAPIDEVGEHEVAIEAADEKATLTVQVIAE